MASCYLCGSTLAPGEGIRKWVAVSRSQRLYIGRGGRIGASGGGSQGLRTVCVACAQYGDDAADRLIGWVIAFCYIIGFLFVVVNAVQTVQKPVFPAPTIQTPSSTPGAR